MKTNTHRRIMLRKIHQKVLLRRQKYALLEELEQPMQEAR